MPGDNHDPKLAELTAILNEVRDRVRARHPSGEAASIPLPDLMPIVHARDAAESKVAAIGTVNPRPPGFVNSIVQGVKKSVARALDWHVREQVEFNHAAVSCVQAVLGALEDANRALAAVATRFPPLEQEGAEMRDLRVHWDQWRRDWEQKLSANEVQFLRSVADLQVAFQHRATLMESNYRDLVRSQHESFTLALERASEDIQKRFWGNMERIRADYEKLIHLELRVIRQRAAAQAAEKAAVSPATPPAVPGPPGVDWLRFADRFRGNEEFVREKQRSYLEKFRGAREVLELGCGRGEFLEVLREGGVNARGIDLSDECVALCSSKGLSVERADLFEYLPDLPPGGLSGVFCAQVVEHLPPEHLPEMIRLAHDKLERGGRLVIETPNPECLAIFATHFFVDPTHTRPIPPALMVFYLEEAGFGLIEVERLSPAVESMPAVASLPADFRETFFGGLDYAVVARKLT